MADLKTTGLSLAVVIAMVTAGTLYLSNNVYYCESRKNLSFQCDEVNNTRCYIGDTYKVCKEGWKHANLFEYIPKGCNPNMPTVLLLDNRDWSCEGDCSDSPCRFGSRISTYGELLK